MRREPPVQPSAPTAPALDGEVSDNSTLGSPTSGVGRNRLVLGAALLLASVNLRPAVTSLGPVLSEVVRSTGLMVAAASVRTALPALCFGLFALVAHA